MRTRPVSPHGLVSLLLLLLLLLPDRLSAAEPAVVIQNTAGVWDAARGKGEHRVFSGAVGEKSAWTVDAHDFGAGKLWTGDTTFGLVYVNGDLPAPQGRKSRLSLWSTRPLRGVFEVYRLTTPWVAADPTGGQPKPIQDGPYRAGGLTLANTTGSPLDTREVDGGHEVTFDVTAAVDAWAGDPSLNHGLLLRRVGGGDTTFVGSGEKRWRFTPRLVIGELERAAAEPDAPWLFTDLANASSWADAGFQEPWNKKGHLRLVRDETGRQVLDIAVEAASGVNVLARPGELAALRPAAGKVYRIRFEGRAVQQIEHVTLHLRQDPAPHRWHGTDSFASSTQWTVHETQIKPRDTVDGCGLYFEFRGVGHYQIRWVRVTELDAFDVSGISSRDTAPRGELLCNPDFALGSAGWTFTVPEWGGHADRFFAPEHDRRRFVPRPGAAGATFRNHAGMFGFLNHDRLLELRFGQRYRIRVRGDAQDDDAFLWIERPAMHIQNPRKIPLRFRDGVAEAIYTHELPEHGTLSIRPQQYFLLVEHFGKAPLTLESVSVVEGQAAAAAQAAVRVEGLGGALGTVAHDGAALRATVEASGIGPGAAVWLQLTDARGRVVHNIGQGAAGLDGSVRLIQGLIGREAAGIGRYFIYTSSPRSFPGQANFHMITGFGQEPLVSTALLPVYVRLLDGLTFAADHSDLQRGTRLYAFTGGGRTVLAGWHLSDSEGIEADMPGRWQPLDCFGQPAGDAREGHLSLTRELRYFVSTDPNAAHPRSGHATAPGWRRGDSLRLQPRP